MTDDDMVRRVTEAGKPRRWKLTQVIWVDPEHLAPDRVAVVCAEDVCPCGGEDPLQLGDRWDAYGLIGAIGAHRRRWGR